MKKEEKLNRLFGEIDDDLVADAAYRPIPIKVWLPRVAAAVAAVALTVGLAVAQPWASEKPPISNGGAITTITTAPDVNGNWDGNEPIGEVYPGVPIASAPAIDQPSNVAPPRPTAGTPTTSAEWTPDIWYEQPWEEKPMWRRYPDFERFEIGNYIVY